ncbi:MAG: 50S ribosomal protein L20, partial [Pseudobdellovibrionaceae bacterium]
VEKNDRALNYAYAHRKTNKREFRALWIQRINAAARLQGTSYSKLMGAIHEKGLLIDRKMLADLAMNDATAFAQICTQVSK